MPQRSLHSPIGDLTVSEEDGYIVSLDWGWGARQSDTPLLNRAVDLLNAYFDGQAAAFAALPLAPAGTDFQRRVWRALQDIPFGETETYGGLARHLATAPRAIGTVCGANPIPILIPCHRVIAADGGLGGYSGEAGVATKAALLRLESAIPEPITV